MKKEYSAKEVAKKLKCTSATIIRWADKEKIGNIKYHPTTRRIYFTEKHVRELEDYAKRHYSMKKYDKLKMAKVCADYLKKQKEIEEMKKDSNIGRIAKQFGVTRWTVYTFLEREKELIKSYL